jgi:hypothetical protein
MTDKPSPIRVVIDNAREIPPRAELDGDGDGRRGSGGPPTVILPEGCPVKPLGVCGRLHYFLDVNNQVIEYKPNDFGRLGLLALFGHKNYLLADPSYWTKQTKQGDVVADYDAAARALMRAASAKGVWDPLGCLRGSGAWLGDDGELVLHLGDAILTVGCSITPGSAHDRRALDAVGRWGEPGVVGRYVYPTEKARPRPWAQSVTRSAGAELLSLLKTWNWRRSELDARLLLGWIGAAMIGGAIKWRPVVWITGGRGTGKSTLQQLIEALFGGAVIAVSDASAAGIWQKLSHSALPVVLDEVEAEDDNRRNQAIVKLARLAASGGQLLRGGADHGSAEFTARSCFMFSSILLPPLQGQDRSRIAVLELDKLGAAPAPELDPRRLRTLGEKLLRRMVSCWSRWPETLEGYRSALAGQGHTARGGDVFGTLLAAADMLLDDGEINTDFVEAIAEQLNVRTLAEADDDVGDEDRCLAHLMTQSIPLDTAAVKRPIAEWVEHARASKAEWMEACEDCAVRGDLSPPPAPDVARRMLGRYGMTVKQEGTELYFAVGSAHAELGKLFQGTHWAGRSGATGVWTQSLRRLPGAAASGKTIYFSGATAKATLIPVTLIPRPPAEERSRAASASARLPYGDRDDA